LQPNEHLLSIERVSEKMGERQDRICLDRNERTVPFPPDILAEMLRSVHSSLLNHYPNPDPLYQRMSRSLELPEDHLYLTNGSDAAVRMLFQTFVRPGDAVVLALPSYAMYGIYAKIFQARPQTVSYRDNLTLDVNQIERLLQEKPRLLMLANPDQPTGAVLEPETLRRLAQTARDRDVLMVIDEAYFPFYPKSAIGWIREIESLVVTRSFSKAGGLAGLRLGYFAARPEVIKSVSRVRGAHEVNAMAIAMGSYILDHPELSQAYIRQAENGRAVLKRFTDELHLEFPTCPANFQLIGFPGKISTKAIVEGLKAKGYLVKGEFSFPGLQRFIRVTLADAATMDGFVRALRKVVLGPGGNR
jgi:histidinol-phosphate aminotransferase